VSTKTITTQTAISSYTPPSSFSSSSFIIPRAKKTNQIHWLDELASIYFWIASAVTTPAVPT